MWLLLAGGAALFAGLTAVLAKQGVRTTDSTVATALRTLVVLAGSWAMVLVVGSQSALTHLDTRSTVLLLLSGLATGASWLCYFRALQDGPASVIVPIDKLSVLVTVLFSALVLHEPVSRRYLVGLALLVAGTLAMLV